MQSENIKYKEGIVTFLDILGFASTLKSESAQTIYELLHTFHYKTIDGPNKIPQKHSKLYDIHILSDCTFKTIDMTNYHENEYAALCVMQEFMFNIISQGTLFYRHGMLLRGAITYGKYFSDASKAVLFGPGIARAYTVESKYAFYPRIYIDPCVLETFHNVLLPQYPFGITESNVTTGKKDEFLKNFYSWISKGDDGIWFLDYLKTFLLWFPSNENPCLFVRKHKTYIENVLSLPDNKLTDDLLLKYLWLGNYHNKTFMNWGKNGWGESLSDDFNQEELLVNIPEKYN